MGVPLVGTRHKRQTGPQKIADRGCRRLSHRVVCSRSGGCSSPNHQQPGHRASTPSKDDRKSSVGTLLSGRTASKRTFHAGLLLGLCEELDSSPMGRLSPERSEDSRGRAVASRHDVGRGKQSKNQVRHVSFVLSRRALRTLQLQPNLFRCPCRKWGEREVRALECASARNVAALR